MNNTFLKPGTMKDIDLGDVAFCFTNASRVDINDGSIKCIWLEDSKTTKLDKDNGLQLQTGRGALIELSNGKKIIITNSEWCDLTIF